MLSWAMELYEKGLITEKDTGGIALEWGDPDVIMGIIPPLISIALKSG